jgi:hypothetical protein
MGSRRTRHSPLAYRNRRTRSIAILPAVVIALAAAAGCTSSGNHVTQQPTMTEQQAAAHAEQILRDTAAVLRPKPTLEVYQPGSATGPCLDDTNPQSAQGRVIVNRTYWLRGIPQSSNATIGQQVLQYWKEKNWVITSTKGVGTAQPEITGLAKPYAFGINLEWSSDGSLSLAASSVCIWPHGTPPPSG